MNNSTCINVLKVLATAMVYFCHSWIVCFETYDYLVHGLYRIFITPAWAGVWIFLVVGGFLAAYGFCGGKYSLDVGGVKRYYKGRLVKILIPTWIFISLGCILIYKEKTVTIVEILQWLTCTFNGNGSLPGIGASWYVFIVMWLYLLAPLFIKIIIRIERRNPEKEFKTLLALLIIVFFFGGLYRAFSFFYLDWYNWTYANVLGCADLFISGMIAYRITLFLPKMSDMSIQKYRAVAILAFVLLICLCFCSGNIIPYYGYLFYQYVYASGYLMITCAILVMFSCQPGGKAASLFNKLTKVANIIAPYTFMYYLWHSFILMYVASVLKVEDDDIHFLLTVFLGILVSSYIAFLMTKMNNGITKSLSKI